jgi:hypothetical protein
VFAYVLFASSHQLNPDDPQAFLAPSSLCYLHKVVIISGGFLCWHNPNGRQTMKMAGLDKLKSG